MSVSKKTKTAAQREKKRESQRKWRLKNLEKVRKSARERARKRWRALSPAKKEKILRKNRITRRKKYHADPKWRKQLYKKSREYVEKNRDKVSEYYKNYHQKVTKPNLASKPRLAEKIRKRKQQYAFDHYQDKKKRRWKKKAQALAICCTTKKVKCVKCGEKGIEKLTLDHIRGRESMGHDGTMMGEKLYTWVIKTAKKTGKRPKGLQPMCLACNFKKQILKSRKNPKYRDEIRDRLKAIMKRNQNEQNQARTAMYEKVMNKIKNDPAYLKKIMSGSKKVKKRRR